MQKTVLVTGGAGFIGSHLCEALIANNHQVYCLDNFYTGSMRNIERLKLLPNFDFIQHDVTYPMDIDLGDIDQIYHLACPASPDHYQKMPIYTWQINVFGTSNMLNLAHEKNAVYLQASTSEVYGDPQIHPQTEAYWGHVNPTGIRACYDEGKRAAETLCFDYWRHKGLPVKVARIFNTYGPNMAVDDGRVVSNFIIQALKQQPLTLYGQGKQTRSFCYVSDIVQGLINLMTSDSDKVGPYNLGNPYERSIVNLAEQIIKQTGSKSQFQFCPLPQDDPQTRKPDITRANNDLHWQPQVTIEQGLIHTVQHFRDMNAETTA